MLKPIAQPGTVRQIEYQLIHIKTFYWLVIALICLTVYRETDEVLPA